MAERREVVVREAVSPPGRDLGSRDGKGPSVSASSGAVAERVVAVLVTFNPDLERLTKAIAALAPQVSRIYVEDNGSANVDGISKVREPKLSLERLGSNMGLARGLNLGSRRALADQPRDWVLLMDQDTILSNDYVERLLSSLTGGDAEKDAGVVAGHFQRRADERALIRTRPWVIISGSLVRSRVFDEARFREDFFVDQIDLDFCAQVREQGYRIYQLPLKLMSHELGKPSQRLWLEFYYEPAGRWYYVVRNSTVLLREGRISLLGYLYQFMSVGAWLLMAEGPGPFLREGWSGLRDASTGRLGPRNAGPRG